MLNYKEIKKNIDNVGFHEIQNFFSDEKILQLKKFVDEKLVENNNEYFFLTSETNENNLLRNENFFKEIENILKNLVLEFDLKINNEEKLYKVLRVVTGKKTNKVSLNYHFDAHLLTLLIPIYIPTRVNSDNGNLIIYKNLRQLHNNLLVNIFQKFFFQSYFFKKILDFNFFKKIFEKKLLYLNPKNIYIFNGFRTLHANLNIDPNDVRATILVHYHDIFYNSYLVKKNRQHRIKREIKNIHNNKQK